ncbi:amidase [Sneathiella sp.]|uniref:amidase n=1 Tax=Sneathiella sp. TaxID=1964365 RepID=UPI00356129BD
MQNALYELTAAQLTEGYRTKKITPVEATQACLDRIADLNPVINAFCLVDEAAALAQAEQSTARWQTNTPLGPLDGVPVSIKDLLLTKDWPTRRGSKVIPAEGDWSEDSPPVARIRDAGGILLGKTTTPEFAAKGVTDSPLTGATRNPWDITRTPGGSSGGAAAAVASGMGPLALGTDAGGSLRIPAAMCGLFTIKPTGGRVPSYPPTPYGSFAASGPISWSVEDAAILLTVLSGDDWRDGSALPLDSMDYANGLNQDLRRLRIGWSPDLGFARPQTAVLDAAEKALGQLEALGHLVEKVSAPFDNPTNTYEDLRAGMTVAAFARMGDAQFAQMDPALVAHIQESRSNANLASYLAADSARTEICRQMRQFHTEFDLLLTPALACTTFEVGIDGPMGMAESRHWSPYTFPFNLTRQPAVTLPCGMDPNGLPLAIQVVGPLYSEMLLLQFSRQYERAYPWNRARATPRLPE